jgi:hypothetical protein
MPNENSTTQNRSNDTRSNTIAEDPMNQLARQHPKVTVSPLGLQVREVLSFEEWAALAPSLGSAVRSVAFVLGDWLVYGESHFNPSEQTDKASGRVAQGRYEAACNATGIDYGTLRNYASVSRKVPMSLRNDKLSWEHHRAVSPLPPDEQKHWLTMAATHEEKISSRRLRTSIAKGELVDAKELTTPPAEQGIPNHIAPINRLTSWWNGAGGERWLGSRSVEQLEALRRDFEPVARIIEAIDSRIESRTKVHREAA